MKYLWNKIYKRISNTFCLLCNGKGKDWGTILGHSIQLKISADAIKCSKWRHLARLYYSLLFKRIKDLFPYTFQAATIQECVMWRRKYDKSNFKIFNNMFVCIELWQWAEGWGLRTHIVTKVALTIFHEHHLSCWFMLFPWFM